MNKKNKKHLNLLLASTFAAALATAGSSNMNQLNAAHHEAKVPGKEKCYGVALKGKNDCHNGAGIHG